MNQQLSISEIRQRLLNEQLSAAELVALKLDKRAGVRKLIAAEERRAEKTKALQAKAERMLVFERELWLKGIELVAGVDEVGRGPLAGPVLAAAVILKPGHSILSLDDSKKLSEKKRQALLEQIKESALCVAYGSASPTEIDELNIFQASFLAMRRAVGALAQSPEHLLIDGGHQIKDVPIAQQAIVGGDGKSQSIAAASVLAKVERDALMENYAEEFPEYGFGTHAGYPTAAHLDALQKHGPSPIHRRSFGPVKKCRGHK